jgi:hypothetical protein
VTLNRETKLERQRLATKKTKEKIAFGLCKQAIYCGRPQIGKSIFCLDHWIQSISRGYTNKKNRLEPLDKKMVKSIWEEQKGLCKVTGAVLIPGDTATLDHIIPVSRGGQGTKNNLRFVHSGVNAFKKTLSEEDFASLILNIGPSLLEWSRNYFNPEATIYLFQGN